MSKAKGSRTERELLHMFFEKKWFCLRVAGSGSMPFPCPDLLAGKKGRVIAIECKSSKSRGRKYISSQQIKELLEFARGFGAEPWVGMRYNNLAWRFLKPNQLGKSNGKTFFVSLELAEKKGLSFKQLLKK